MDGTGKVGRIRPFRGLPKKIVARCLRMLETAPAHSYQSPPVPEDPHQTGITPAIRARYPEIVEEAFWEIAQRSVRYTLLSIEQLYDVYKSIEYLCKSGIQGDVVECGVYKGGSMLMAADALAHFGSTSRKIYLFDTFEGMTHPTAHDVNLQGESMLERYTKYDHTTPCFLEETKHNLRLTRYPFERLIFVKGPVEQTIPNTLPERIAFLRLDTDWYASTKHELIHLYPRVVAGGVVTIDDYGAYQGARQAVDEYLRETKQSLRLFRIDYTCRSTIKWA